MEKFITTPDGLSLWTESFGRPEHPPILLVMGAMNQGIFWPDGFCEALAAAGFYVVRFDHRDTGQSSTVDFQSAPYDLDTLTDDAVAVIHGHRLVRPTVVGLSMGGYIAQLMAVRHPGIASRLVLISSTSHIRLTGHALPLICRTQAYFAAHPAQSTPRLFLRCRAPSSAGRSRPSSARSPFALA